MAEHQHYWDRFYSSRASSAVPLEPSAFAQWAASLLPVGQLVVEFGFGNARDALWFAHRGHPVVGYDFAASAVDHAQRRAVGEDVDVQFTTLDLYDPAACQEVAERTLASGVRPAAYGRFLLHALETSGRHNFFDLAARMLSQGGQLLLEFRTHEDRGEAHAFGEDHYRAYLDPVQVSAELEERGALLTHSLSGRGLAVYKDEDPHVARLVATFDRAAAS